MPTDGERLATLEEAKRNTEQAIHAIFLYMQEGRNWRSETDKTLSKMVQNQDAMAAYQIRCDDERKEIVGKADLVEKRVTVTEGFQKRATRAAAIIGIVFGGGMWGAPKAFAKIVELIS